MSQRDNKDKLRVKLEPFQNSIVMKKETSKVSKKERQKLKHTLNSNLGLVNLEQFDHNNQLITLSAITLSGFHSIDRSKKSLKK
jgi:hypothetical protein